MTTLSLKQLASIASNFTKHLNLFGVEWVQEDAMSIYSRVWYSTVESDIYKIELNCKGIVVSIKTEGGSTSSQQNWISCPSPSPCTAAICVGETLAKAVSENRLFSELAYEELERRYNSSRITEDIMAGIIEKIQNTTGKNVVVFRTDSSGML